MKFIYGTYEHNDEEVELREFRQEVIRGQRGRRDKIRKTMVIQGTRIQSGQSSIKSEIEEIEAAYEEDGFNAGLLHDDDSRSGFFLDSGQSLSGVKVEDFRWLSAEPATYKTGVVFQVTLSAEFLPKFSGDGILSWREQLIFVGTTGPVFAHVPLLRSPPQKQIIAQRSTQNVIQAGEAVGRVSRPTPPGPIWPQHEMLNRREISPVSPRRDGVGFTDFAIRWTYHFQSAVPLSGQPTFR